MNYYETNIIIKPTLSKVEVKKLVDQVVDIIKKNSGSIVHQHNSEVKQLAYTIQKYEKGYYQILEFEAPPALVQPLEVFYQREEAIIRYITIALDKYAITYNEQKKLSNKISTKSSSEVLYDKEEKFNKKNLNIQSTQQDEKEQESK
ncbi:MAG: 30S ribosomal protein S6 [Bacteroidota bacterium]